MLGRSPSAPGSSLAHELIAIDVHCLSALCVVLHAFLLPPGVCVCREGKEFSCTLLAPSAFRGVRCFHRRAPKDIAQTVWLADLE